MKTTYWQAGNTLDYKNTGSVLIAAGSVVALSNRIGIAGTDIEPNRVGSVHVVGVFEMSKAAEEIAVGQELYYDKTNLLITKTATEIKAGFAFGNKAAADTTVLVKIG
jgi:predicted RecA/RadA family phage recombinase